MELSIPGPYIIPSADSKTSIVGSWIPATIVFLLRLQLQAVYTSHNYFSIKNHQQYKEICVPNRRLLLHRESLKKPIPQRSQFAGLCSSTTAKILRIYVRILAYMSIKYSSYKN